MLSEIGSNFWQYSFDLPKREKKLWWESGDYNRLFFKSGRNAIKALARQLKDGGARVLLPAYTCETVILPFIDEGYEISYYGINSDMSLNIESLLNLIETFQPNLVLFHSYFGFDTLSVDKSVIEGIHDRGITIIEDITQSVFSEHYIECSDYYVSSLRKFMAIPDGGVLFSKKELDITDICSHDNAIVKIALEAFDQKAEYIAVSQNEELKERFRDGYVNLNHMIADNNHLMFMSSESLQIFESCDVDYIRTKRRENFESLASVIREIDGGSLVISETNDKTAPLYLPIYVKGDRKALQHYLAENKVYCPVIWPKPSQVTCDCEKMDYMYAHMLCIPIDQRYGEDELCKIERLFREYREVGG